MVIKILQISGNFEKCLQNVYKFVIILISGHKEFIELKVLKGDIRGLEDNVSQDWIICSFQNIWRLRLLVLVWTGLLNNRTMHRLA